jgi:nitrile hydratase
MSSRYLPHDIGGNEELFAPIDVDPHDLQQWELQCHALFAVLATKKILGTDQLRRAIEDLTPKQYSSWTYYEKWTAAMVTLLLESGVISYQDLRYALFGADSDTVGSGASSPRFQTGNKIRVKPYQPVGGVEWRRPHIRVPGYIYGVNGRVVDVCGQFGDPSFLAFGIEAPRVWLYRVEFSMADLWPEQSTSSDTVSIEVYEHWLEPSQKGSGHSFEDVTLLNHDDDGSDCINHGHHEHEHNNDHGDHSHDPRPHVERRAVRKEGEPRPGIELFEALYKIVSDKNLVSRDEIRAMIEGLESAGEKLNGATLVVKAWTDPAFKERLLEDPANAAMELGIQTSNPNAPTVLTVVENTSDIHNLVVCTLCSCYPSGLLGVAPSWYKSSAFRSRAVREPKQVLEDFGTVIPSAQSIRVHDSTADHRYLVLPKKPKDTDGWSEEELRRLVTRDSMIGTTVPVVE